MTALSLFGAGCGDQAAEPFGDDPGSTTSSSVGTSTTVNTTEPSSSHPPENCPGASANSPATFHAERGTYAAFITAFPSADSEVTFDVVQWLTGQRARDAYREDNPDEGDEGPPNDYHVRNESEQTRSAPLAENVRVWLLDHVTLRAATPAELSDYLEGRGAGDIFWLTFDDGSIVETCLQYRP